MSDQPDDLIWSDKGVPISARFDDPYYSLDDGLAETRHAFLDGNDLPARYRDGFSIAELGFGTGLNAATALHAWREANCAGVLHFTSFELFPLPGNAIEEALAAFPSIGAAAKDVSRAAAGYSVSDFSVSIVEGDARQTLAEWRGAADAWFLDGFAPAKNPELWEADLLSEVATHTAPGGTFATYTAAGDVRRALEVAGFEVSRVPGFGRKRHMTIGRLR